MLLPLTYKNCFRLIKLIIGIGSIILFIFFQSCKLTFKSNKRNNSEQSVTSTIDLFRSFKQNAIDNRQLNREERIFKNGLNQISNHNFDSAKTLFLQLYYTTISDTIRKESAKIIYNILFYQSKWKELSTFDSIANKGIEDKDNIMILSKAFANSPEEKVVYSVDSATTEWMESVTGCPIVPCYINGHKRFFWFDSGANYSVISSDIAEECDVSAISSSPSKALTATVRKINIYPAVVDSLSIANLTIYNSPFVIVHDFDLKLRLIGSKSKIKIDGIIGWKAIQNMDVTIDFPNNLLVVKKPVRKDIPVEQKNFFWLGCPFVKIQANGETPLIFGLDLGAASTCITHQIFNKIDYEKIYERVKPQTSAGGAVYFNSKLLSHLPVKISGSKVDFFNIRTTYQVPHLFVQLDGILGSDFMKNSIIRLDILNGIFEYLPQKE